MEQLVKSKETIRKLVDLEVRIKGVQFLIERSKNNKEYKAQLNTLQIQRTVIKKSSLGR